ncbi:MAG TPA: (Fe-S)-binding protein [Aggregatilineales bacterium]|nr:(Fe-S)-binding protein [Aggregatilineales bacterium]
MLTIGEKILFALLVMASFGVAFDGFYRMYKTIMRGEGELYFDNLIQRAFHALRIYITQETTLKTRKITSLLHVGVVWGFTFYFLVNLGDFLEGFLPDFKFLGDTVIADAYHFVGDILTAAVLVGVAYFIVRRLFLPNRKELQFHDNVRLHPKVAAGGVRVDSMIVAWFILLHVGSRFTGESIKVALDIRDGTLMPFADILSLLWTDIFSASEGTLQVLEHITWWLALGSIILFIPYFPYSKHAHLFMAPLNFLTRPKRTSLGEMPLLDIEDEQKEQLGVERIEHLHKTAIFDAFACIMCNRCQDVCPAYTTGKELSPSALEINKRYMIRDNFLMLAAGGESDLPLMGNAISESAVWACTSCGACIDICPVGNEPMLDILEIRRDEALMKGQFPKELTGAFNGMERQGNPWQLSESRFAWAKDMIVPTVEDNPNFEILYWVGCAASYDARAQITARSFVKVLQAANVNFAVLGEMENCTGDVARRAGKEDIFFQLATQNVETLNSVNPKRIVVTCPHCLHNLGKEYHQYGGDFDVIHHTELIEELISAGKIPESAHPRQQPNVTFHDPCYLGRHNGVFNAPRNVMQNSSIQITEMPRNRKNSFCCGAGGAQFWKEEEPGTESVSVARYKEARDTGAEVLAVGCPFCMQMFTSAEGLVENAPPVKDVVELIAENLPETESAPVI